ncbi:DUF4390 domain-containing protein [Hydrogenophaga sp.]|uniref:DUF4390 domain-containing protein n=1 Tax=Hydrogenophaga sp. TaxID=1904254 RepID=UPI0035B35AE1
MACRRWLWAWLCGCFLALPAVAQAPQAQQVSVQRGADGVFLSVRLTLTPADVVEDALTKGVPLYFVWQAEVMRLRWYWYDKRVASATRVLRLAFQPLTRRWRMSVSNEVGANPSASGLQYALHQSFDSLDDALAAVGRVVRWKIADAGQLDPSAEHRIEASFQLDLSLLPRPFQFGMANQPDWSVEWRQRLPLPAPETDATAEALSKP